MLQPLASLNAVPPQSGEVDRSNVDLSSHGYVVALLNQPSCLIRRWAVLPQSGEVDRSNVALSLDHPQKLMQVGVSQDFTLLQGHHYEKKCFNFANKSDGGLAYNKMRSQRMECHRGWVVSLPLTSSHLPPSPPPLHLPPPPPHTSLLPRYDKNFQKSKTEVFFYGGQSFSAGGGGGTREWHSTDKCQAICPRGQGVRSQGYRRDSKHKTLKWCPSWQDGCGHTRVLRPYVSCMVCACDCHECALFRKQVARGHSIGAQYLNVQQMKEEASKDG